MAQPQQFITNLNIGGIDCNTNPLVYGIEQTIIANDGKLIRSVNMDSLPLGAKTRRSGYNTFLGTTQTGGSQVNSLFQWIQDNGTANFLYCYAGGILNYYDVSAGTATDWLPCGNGTFAAGTHVGYAILNDTLTCGDGVGSTRYSTDGTSFTNTTAAPAGEFFEQYQNSLYVGGTASTVIKSATGDPTNFTIGGTSDSTSFTVPGAGKINKVWKIADRLLISKTYGQIFTWDGNTLIDTATNLGPSSPYSVGTVADGSFYLHRLGIYLCDSTGPTLISTPITKYFYNQHATGILGTAWGTAPAGIKRLDYYCSVGSVQDDLTYEPLNNAVIKYNYQKNEFLTYQYNDAPTAWGRYYDAAGSEQLVFGNSSGQVFKISDTANTDNNNPINSVFDMVWTANSPQYQKDWRWLWVYASPGCEATIQVALAETFSSGRKNWINIGISKDGIYRYRFPSNSRSRILFTRVSDAGVTAPYTIFGFSLSYQIVDPG